MIQSQSDHLIFITFAKNEKMSALLSIIFFKESEPECPSSFAILANKGPYPVMFYNLY
jgi:hypothetical protein